MKTAGWLMLLIALAGCPPARTTTVKPPPPAYEVARAAVLGLVATDETHVYWADAGIHRRPHGPAGAAERLYATDAYFYDLAVGSADVFFIDESNVLRAIPKSGGGPTTLATIEGSVWAIAADGETVWVGVDDRLEGWSREPGHATVKLPRPGVKLAIADGEAYVTSYDQPTLLRANLAFAKITPLSDAWYFSDAYDLAISGKSVLAAYSDGVVAVPRKGGDAQIVFANVVTALAGDDVGYVANYSTAIVVHQHGKAPRLVATSDMKYGVGAVGSLALSAEYAYHIDYIQIGEDAGNYLLRGSPRRSGAEMLRLPLGSYVLDVAVADDVVYAATQDGDGEHILRVDGRRSTPVATTPPYVEALVGGDGGLALSSDGRFYSVDLDGKRVVDRGGDYYWGYPIAVHKGLVFWASYAQVYALPLEDGRSEPILVADATTVTGEEGAQVTSLEFASDHMYFTIAPYVGSPGLVRVDEERNVERVWTYEGNGVLAGDLAAIGGTVYVHDATTVWAYSHDGGETAVVWQHDDADIRWIDDAGTHLVAWVWSPDGEELIEIKPKSGKTKVLWRSYLDGGTYSSWDVGTDAVYLTSNELFSILRIPVE